MKLTTAEREMLEAGTDVEVTPDEIINGRGPKEYHLLKEETELLLIAYCGHMMPKFDATPVGPVPLGAPTCERCSVLYRRALEGK